MIVKIELHLNTSHIKYRVLYNMIIKWGLIIDILHLSLTNVLEKLRKWNINFFGQIIVEQIKTLDCEAGL